MAISIPGATSIGGSCGWNQTAGSSGSSGIGWVAPICVRGVMGGAVSGNGGAVQADARKRKMVAGRNLMSRVRQGIVTC